MPTPSMHCLAALATDFDCWPPALARLLLGPQRGSVAELSWVPVVLRHSAKPENGASFPSQPQDLATNLLV